MSTPLPASAAAPITASFDPVSGVLTVTGDNANNVVTISRITNVKPGHLTVNGGQVPITGGRPHIGNTGSVVVTGLDGHDSLQLDQSVSGLPAALLSGGSGNDTLTGGSLADDLRGGSGQDTVRGQRGADSVTLDEGNDTVFWNFGDGSDFVSAGTGTDRLQVTGSAANESIELSNSFGLAQLVHQQEGATVSGSGLERIDIAPGSGSSLVTVRDLFGTSVTDVGVTSVSPFDTVRIEASNSDDFIQAFGDATSFETGSFAVLGLTPSVGLTGFVSTDAVNIRGNGGHDTILGQGSFFDPVDLSVDWQLEGGAGDDHLEGSQGDDSLNGGEGNDFLNPAVNSWPTYVTAGSAPTLSWAVRRRSTSRSGGGRCLTRPQGLVIMPGGTAQPCTADHGPFRYRCTALVSRNSSSPATPNSRPLPDSR